MEKLVLTQSGYDDINEEYQYLMKTKRPQIIERIKEARELGDLSENFDYHDAKREQAVTESRLNELKYILDHAEIVTSKSDGSVQLGSIVVVKDLDEGFEDTYKVVGQAESDPADSKISCDSPMGNALMGKLVGDIAEFEAPFGHIRCEIISVK